MYVNNNNIKTIARVEIIHGGKKLLLVSKPKHIGSISCKNKSMSSVQKNNFRKRTNLSIHVLHASGGTILCYFWRIVKIQNTRWWQHRQSRQKKGPSLGSRKKSKVVFRFRTPTYLICSLDYLGFMLI